MLLIDRKTKQKRRSLAQSEGGGFSAGRKRACGKPVISGRPARGKSVYESNLAQLLNLAAVEDLGRGDITSQAIIPEKLLVHGYYLAKADGVVAGVGILDSVFRAFGPGVRVRPRVGDGDRVRAGVRLAEVCGPARTVLAGERLSLNLLCRLSGIASLTAEYVKLVRGTRARIYDTRKTTPALRWLERQAVAAGGGCNHRFGLHDAVLIKDNHLALTGQSPAEAVRRARRVTRRPVEVEVVDLAGLEEAVKAGVDVVMLDNFPPPRVAGAVRLARRLAAQRGRRVEIEVSGGVNLKTVRAYARANPDRISIGALTHSAPALDISLELERV